MTAGGGIMHEEMPQLDGGHLDGFQLWVNLPARLKMSKPRYQEIVSPDIPSIEQDNGVRIRVIAGTVGDVSGSVKEIAADPTYLDISVPANTSFNHPIPRGHTAFAYVFAGEGDFGIGDDNDGKQVTSPRLVVFDDGDRVQISASEKGVRFLLISGKPLNEPIARYGPFVMNTDEEIEQALSDLRRGTFVK
jgi:redox-sensitive bicupin YhaK (pirin superfamily)